MSVNPCEGFRETYSAKPRTLITILSLSGDHQASKFSPCSRIEVGVLESNAKEVAGWGLQSEHMLLHLVFDNALLRPILQRYFL